MIQYGTVTGRLVTAVVDTAIDPDFTPDNVPLSGTITFSPSARSILSKVDEKPTTVLPTPITVTLNANGEIEHEGALGVSLIATDDPNSIPVNWTYKVSFSLTHGGRPVRYSSFDIAVPAGVTTDLTDVAPLDSSGGVIITKGDAGRSITGVDVVDITMTTYFSDGTKQSIELPVLDPSNVTTVEGRGISAVEQPTADTMRFLYTDGTYSATVTLVRGPQGATGPQGLQGLAGPKGDTGATGLQGPKGNTGATGPAGPEGPQGPVGATGATGPQGPIGPEGAQGASGQDGTSLELRGTVATYANLPADPLDNDAYMLQDTGHLWVYDTTNGWVDAGKIRGPQGPTGPEGPTGATGPVGPEGPQGLQGIQGATGPEGPAGPEGPQGVQGIQGEQGPAGQDAGVRIYLQETAPTAPEVNSLWIW